jgi:antitoxin (DNA-binding transcriptional repressor) of toxin-antitoxin stability system
VVRSHRRDIDALREAAPVLLSELSAPVLNLKVTERSRVIADLSTTMARLVPLERQGFGLDEDKRDASQSMTVVWEGMPAPLVGDPDRGDLASDHAVLGRRGAPASWSRVDCPLLHRTITRLLCPAMVQSLHRSLSEADLLVT